MLRLVAATVAVEDERRSALDKRAAECVHTGYDERNGLYDARAAALPRFRVWIGSRLPRHLVRLVGRIAARVVHVNRRRTSAFLTSRCCSPPRYFEAELRGLPSEVGLRFVPTRNMQISRATQIGPTSK